MVTTPPEAPWQLPVGEVHTGDPPATVETRKQVPDAARTAAVNEPPTVAMEMEDGPVETVLPDTNVSDFSSVASWLPAPAMRLSY